MGKEHPEKERLFRGLVEGVYTTKEVAMRLDLSESRVKQLKKSFLERGEKALTHGNSGRRPPNCIGEDVKAKIVSLKTSDVYNEASFSMFRKTLDMRHGVNISYTALSKILKDAGIMPGSKQRETRYFRRKRAFGERLGLFAFFHDWFGDETVCVLHGLVDDATKRITALHFCRDECAEGYAEVLRLTFATHGVPRELYAENPAALFDDVKEGDRATDDESPPPFGLFAAKRLGMAIKGDADAPYAKIRIGHLRNALRNRLARWLKRKGVTHMEQANPELRHYVAFFNDIFANEPREAEPAFVPLPPTDGVEAQG